MQDCQGEEQNDGTEMEKEKEKLSTARAQWKAKRDIERKE